MFWWTLCFHSLAVEQLAMEGEKQKLKKQQTAKILRKRLLLWLLWCVLTVVLSTLAVLYQVAKSIPGTLPADKILSLALQACIGAAQGCVSSFIVPYLASKMAWKKHVFTSVSNLLMNCIIPAVVVIYFDTGCLGRWASWWKTCRSNSQLLQCRVHCPPSGTFRNPQPLVFSQKYRRYKWEAYCVTNGGRIAVQIGGVLRRFPFSEA